MPNTEIYIFFFTFTRPLAQFFITNVNGIDADKGTFAACISYKLSWCESNEHVLNALAETAGSTCWAEDHFLWKPQCRLSNLVEEDAGPVESWSITTDDLSTQVLPGDPRILSNLVWVHQHVRVSGTFKECFSSRMAAEQWNFPFDMEQLHISFISTLDVSYAVLKFSQLETSGIVPGGFVSDTYSMHTPRLIGFDSDWGEGNVPFLSSEHESPTGDRHCSAHIAMVITRKNGVMWKAVVPQVFLVLASFSAYAFEDDATFARVVLLLMLFLAWSLCRVATVSGLPKTPHTTAIDMCQYGVLSQLALALLGVCIVASLHTYENFARRHGADPTKANLACFFVLVFYAFWVLLFMSIHSSHLTAKRDGALKEHSSKFEAFMRGCKRNVMDASQYGSSEELQSCGDVRNRLRKVMTDNKAERPEPLVVGSIVDGLWEEKCGGRVVAIAHKAFDVQLHSDGFAEGPKKNLARSDLKSVGYNVPQLPPSVVVEVFEDPQAYQRLPLGCTVEASYEQSGNFFKGRIAYSHSPNTAKMWVQSYDIWFDSGCYERNVLCDHIIVQGTLPSLGHLKGCVFSQNQVLG